MATLAMIYGIIIKMNSEKNAHVAEFLANWKLLNEENGTYFRITD